VCVLPLLTLRAESSQPERHPGHNENSNDADLDDDDDCLSVDMLEELDRVEREALSQQSPPPRAARAYSLSTKTANAATNTAGLAAVTTTTTTTAQGSCAAAVSRTSPHAAFDLRQNPSPAAPAARSCTAEGSCDPTPATRRHTNGSNTLGPPVGASIASTAQGCSSDHQPHAYFNQSTAQGCSSDHQPHACFNQSTAPQQRQASSVTPHPATHANTAMRTAQAHTAPITSTGNNPPRPSSASCSAPAPTSTRPLQRFGSCPATMPSSQGPCQPAQPIHHGGALLAGTTAQCSLGPTVGVGVGAGAGAGVGSGTGGGPAAGTVAHPAIARSSSHGSVGAPVESTLPAAHPAQPAAPARALSPSRAAATIAPKYTKEQIEEKRLKALIERKRLTAIRLREQKRRSAETG
jgi:hypothetical protein